MPEPISLLIFESNPTDGELLLSVLRKLDGEDKAYKVHLFSTLKEGLHFLTQQEFDLIIVNLNLPDSQGLETFLEIQKKISSLPIIIIGDEEEKKSIEEAIKLGAQDYLPKTDITPSLLSRALHYAIERNRLHEGLKALSFTDELTGLYNRRGFLTLLEQQISLARRMKKGFYFFLVDLDYLKKINDTYGHLIGDRALIQIAHFLRTSFRHYDIIGRLGGDEFGVIALNTLVENGEYLKNHLLEDLRAYNKTLNEPYVLSFSVGMVYYDGLKVATLDALFQEADASLYIEKHETH